MRQLCLLLVFEALFTINLTAQISLDSLSYPESEIGTDSLKVTTSASPFPSLTPMAGGMWDLSVVTDSTPIFFNYRVASASYQFADSNLYNFSLFKYLGNEQWSIRNLGMFLYGINILKTNYSISSITGGGLDSFIIPQQNMMFSNPCIQIAFPTTMGTSWSSTYYSDLEFKLTYLMGGDTSAPGIVRRYTTEKDTVTGWGKMRIKNAAGGVSDAFDVLQVERRITHTDSFFLNGAPFSSTMLTFFSVTQGQKDTIYEQNYYRQSEVTPLAQVEFRDAAYTQPYKATTHVQRLQNVGVKNIPVNTNIHVYPNPVCDHSVYINLPSGGGKWKYELADITSRIVAKDAIDNRVNPAIISLPATLVKGNYYLKLLNDGLQVAVSSLEIAQ